MAIAIPAVIKDARRRQRRRWIGVAVVAAAVAVTASWAGGWLSGGGGPGPAAVVRGDGGWTLVSPSGFHRRSFTINEWRSGERGVSIGNFSPLPPARSMDRPSSLRVPPHGVLFQLYTWWAALESPIGRDVRLPLTLRDFPGFTKAPAGYGFTANGDSFVAVVGVGRDVSHADLQALKQLISSVRFRSLRTGEVTRTGYLVLKRPNAYPLGTVTRVDPRRAELSPFYLFHDSSGLRAIGWQTVSCEIRLDRAHNQFFCPAGGRWDLAGNVIVNPPGAKEIEPLERYATATSQGHLVVTESVQYEGGCAAELARHVPACPNYQPDSSSSRTS